jgi:hypothetical protein
MLKNVAKVNQKKTKELLTEWATAKGKVDNLLNQQQAVTKPIQEKADKQIAKAIAPFQEQYNEAHADMTRLAFEIETEIKKGFDGKNYAVTKVDGDGAFVEVKTTESREIEPEAWLKEIPKAKQIGGFWKTIKVQIGESVKQFSEVVNKLATTKRTHQVIVRLK